MSKLQGVADTLYIPLTARIYASKRFPEYFYDEKALELEKELPDDSIERRSSEYSKLASVARYYNFDAIVKDFCDAHPRCNVVNLGAGLETAYFRLRPREAVFYELDLPDVIEMRRRVLGEAENDILIAGDLFDLAWVEKVDTSLPTLLTVSGVFQYFHKEDILGFIAGVKERFPYLELLFDAANESGIKYANVHVKRTGNTAATMYFFVNDGAAFAAEVGVTLLEERPFFTAARRMLKGKVNLYSRVAMRLADNKRGVILRLRLH